MNRRVENIELRVGAENGLKVKENEQEVKKELGSEGERTERWTRLN